LKNNKISLLQIYRDK